MTVNGQNDHSNCVYGRSRSLTISWLVNTDMLKWRLECSYLKEKVEV